MKFIYVKSLKKNKPVRNSIIEYFGENKNFFMNASKYGIISIEDGKKITEIFNDPKEIKDYVNSSKSNEMIVFCDFIITDEKFQGRLINYRVSESLIYNYFAVADVYADSTDILRVAKFYQAIWEKFTDKNSEKLKYSVFLNDLAYALEGKIRNQVLEGRFEFLALQENKETKEVENVFIGSNYNNLHISKNNKFLKVVFNKYEDRRETLNGKILQINAKTGAITQNGLVIPLTSTTTTQFNSIPNKIYNISNIKGHKSIQFEKETTAPERRQLSSSVIPPRIDNHKHTSVRLLRPVKEHPETEDIVFIIGKK